jgi:multidrug efflux pump subunit AcrB
MDLLVSGALRVDSLVTTREETEPSSIRRDNRRRTASITVATGPMDPRRVKQELNSLFTKLDLPPGYSVEFDPEAIKQAQALSATVLSLVMAVIFCYMIIASINESFTAPLIVLSAIPSSLSIPALCLFLSGSAYNSAVACAFIAVSGMTVNAAVLCVDGVNSTIKKGREKNSLSVYLALRKKMPALLSTTGTTVAGAIPFLFLTEGANALIRTLSLTGALGVACSCICSITVIPSLLTISRKKSSRLCGIKSLFLE